MKTEILDVLRAVERDHDTFTLKASLGHFLLHDEDLTAVTYDEEDGLVAFLDYLVRNGWTAIEEEGHAIGAEKEKEKVLLGPGGQVNWIYGPFQRMPEIDRAYLDFLELLFDELKRKNQILLAAGHQPVSVAEDLPEVPGTRNETLLRVAKGNPDLLDVLKGAASMEVAFQYAHSDNFEKRFHSAGLVQQALAALFDNVGWIEGQAPEGVLTNLNKVHTADDRLTNIEYMYDEGFKYEAYADYVLKAGEVYEESGISVDGAKALMEAVLAPVRASEDGIVVGQIDSVPYPLNMAAILLMKDLLYTPDHMTSLQKMIEDTSGDKLESAENELYRKGLEGKFNKGTFMDLVKDLLFMVSLTINQSEQHYTQPLNSLIFKGARPGEVAARQYASMLEEDKA